MKIEMNKKYRRVGTHEPVRVICVDAKCPTPVLMLVGEKEEWVAGTNEQGFCYGIKFIEEVPAVDWSKVKVDTPIFVKYAGELLKRHFSNFDGKYVYFYSNGKTSFTCNGSFPILSVYMDDCWLEEPR